MEKPIISERETVFQYNVKTIWNIVINNKNYKWRTGIEKIDILENDRIEYYDKNSKHYTKFTLKNKEEYKLYSFDMENKIFFGTWTGKFIEININETKYVFIEKIFMKNRVKAFLAKYFWNIGKIQEKYFHDLRSNLAESTTG